MVNLFFQLVQLMILDAITSEDSYVQILSSGLEVVFGPDWFYNFDFLSFSFSLMAKLRHFSLVIWFFMFPVFNFFNFTKLSTCHHSYNLHQGLISLLGDLYNPVWFSLIQFVIWSKLKKVDPIWSNFNRSDLIWSNFNQFDPILTKQI